MKYPAISLGIAFCLALSACDVGTPHADVPAAPAATSAVPEQTPKQAVVLVAPQARATMDIVSDLMKPDAYTYSQTEISKLLAPECVESQAPVPSESDYECRPDSHIHAVSLTNTGSGLGQIRIEVNGDLSEAGRALMTGNLGAKPSADGGPNQWEWTLGPNKADESFAVSAHLFYSPATKITEFYIGSDQESGEDDP